MNKNILGKFEDMKMDHIDCTFSKIKNLAWVKHRKSTIACIIVSIILSLIILLFFIVDNKKSTFCLFIFSLCIIPSNFFIIVKLAYADFMRKFAEDNNFLYQYEISGKEISDYFPPYIEHSVKHVVTGLFYGYKARVFHNRTSCFIGISRIENFINIKKNFINITAVEVFLGDIDCAHIFLKPSKSYENKLERKEKNDTNITLDAEFDRDYKLIATKGYNIEALRIFNKEVLRLIKKSGCGLRVKIKKDRLYVYWNNIIYKKEALYNMFQVAGAIIKSIEPVMKRMKGDFDSLHPYFRKS
jgi:hypothetical protein